MDIMSIVTDTRIMYLFGILLTCCCLLYLFKRGNKDYVKAIILKLVSIAEQQFGSKTGQIKFAMVYSSLPIWVRLFFSQQELTELIKDAVTWLKAEINGDKNLLSIADELSVKYLNSSVNVISPVIDKVELDKPTETNNTIPTITSIPTDIQLNVEPKPVKVEVKKDCTLCVHRPDAETTGICKECIANDMSYYKAV